MAHPLDRLKHHVTGAIKRGEKTAIAAVTHNYAATIDRTAIDAFCVKWPCNGIDARIWRVWCRWNGNGDLQE